MWTGLDADTLAFQTIVAIEDFLPPVRIGQVPPDGIGQQFAVIRIWLPPELSLELARVDRVPHVVPWPIRHVGNEFLIRLSVGTRFERVHDPAKFFHQIDVPHFIVATDGVRLPNLAARDDRFNCFAMIDHMEPIPNVQTLAIDRNGLLPKAFQNHHRDELFGELIRPVVVRAVGHQDRQAIGVAPGADEMVGRGLARRIGRARIEGGGLAETARRTE